MQPKAGPRPVVLIVEDEILVRLDAVEVIEGRGFEAIEASNADEAISILEQRNDIGLIFTDIDMAGSMDGVKLAHFVKDRWPPMFPKKAELNSHDLELSESLSKYG